MSEVLRIEGLWKVYSNGSEDLEVLKDISLSVEENSVVIITGESGSGKSTLLNLVGGLDSPTKGEIISHGNKVSSLGEDDLTTYRRNHVGFIFQFHFLLKDFTALENVMLPAYIAGVPKKEAQRRALDLLERVRLVQRKNHYPAELSGGERQKVAVARSLINDPPLILADEPTGNLDEVNAGIVKELLFSLVRSYKKTLLFVSHDISLKGVGDRHLVLEHGVLRES
ncbi:MAG TPA: ABC transporter ATP-binding protein [Spirochaetia bacterium]|nr:ABC transporter ATP-binding protein [Spirochaetia bacterium]